MVPAAASQIQKKSLKEKQKNQQTTGVLSFSNMLVWAWWLARIFCAPVEHWLRLEEMKWWQLVN